MSLEAVKDASSLGGRDLAAKLNGDLAWLNLKWLAAFRLLATGLRFTSTATSTT
jgi:hypothetical protein